MKLIDLLKEFLLNKEYETKSSKPRNFHDIIFFARPLINNSYVIEHLLDSKPDMDFSNNLSFRVRGFIIVLDRSRSNIGVWDFSHTTLFFETIDILENDVQYNILKYGKFLLTDVRN